MGKRILSDILVWAVCGTLYILFRVMAQKADVLAYVALFGAMTVLWIMLGLLCGKYKKSYREAWYWQELLQLCLTGGLLMLVLHFTLPILPWQFSQTVALWMVGIVMIVESIMQLGMHYWKFALNMTVPVMEVEQRDNAVVGRPDEPRNEKSQRTIHETVLSLTTEDEYQMLVHEADLNNKRTKVVANRDRYSFLEIPDYQYDTLVDLILLNQLKGINRRLCIINQKLPDNGRYVCCYRPQEYIKKKILASYPKGINYLVYIAWFIWRRLLPRLLLFSRLYYDLTKGKKRVLSKTEVLGRLYYCGFEVEKIIPSEHIEYVFARRHSQPYDQEQIKVYGPLIKLPRVCKDEKIVYFYKFRTMHPYSEYIQKYVFDQRGGMNIADKSDDDFRITTWGKWMRRYWLDELPMLINWLKGDVKLVGIRPLSRTMFNTYPEELQRKRTRTKPGLIPPFYIDHPKTFDELYASENKYLDEYFRHPFWTDVKYFFLTVYSILFKRMHSA